MKELLEKVQSKMDEQYEEVKEDKIDNIDLKINASKELKEELEKNRKKEEKNKIEKEKLIEKAKNTGEKQIYKQYSVECNDPKEECCIDTITEYIDNEGKIIIQRSHTY